MISILLIIIVIALIILFIKKFRSNNKHILFYFAIISFIIFFGLRFYEFTTDLSDIDYYKVSMYFLYLALGFCLFGIIHRLLKRNGVELW